MKLLVIGATRGVGLELVRLALAEGHEVTALARRPQDLAIDNDRLKVIQGGILDRIAVAEAVSGQDAVCVTIGIGPTRRPVTIFSEGGRIVIEAMEQRGCRRLICVTGIGAGDSRGHGGFLYDRIFKPLLLQTIYDDKDRQEALARRFTGEWEIVRPGFLTNGPRTGKYRALTDLTGVTAGKISRADVADFVLREAAEMKYRGQTPLLTY